VFRQEATRVAGRGPILSYSSEWVDEVKTLIRQAFSSDVPLEDLESLLAGSPNSSVYSSDEPF